ncbi:hypothetical protein PVK06_012612 [Gossypium arboreum]|uniref:Uncharacterized protein n=1 Tax=Gossypium arboreum TaxID=29729 RepID=A0ABR0QCM9_GOSAR|nr:hypothetical protein PVK06_012612 [Gossypium arboreum]
MVLRDTHVSPLVQGGNNHTRRRSSLVGAFYQWRSSNRAWKSAQSVRCEPPTVVLATRFIPSCKYAKWYFKNELVYIYQGEYILIPEHTQLEFTRWHKTGTRPHCNRVPPYRNIDSFSNTDHEPEYEASEKTSHTFHLNPPPFEEIFGEDLEP